MSELIVTGVFADYIVCWGKDKEIYIDTEDLPILFEVGDKLRYIEHGFCDVYRSGELIAGLTNLFTRKFIK